MGSRKKAIIRRVVVMWGVLNAANVPLMIMACELVGHPLAWSSLLKIIIISIGLSFVGLGIVLIAIMLVVSK
jgi:hypothetical protein